MVTRNRTSSPAPAEAPSDPSVPESIIRAAVDRQGVEVAASPRPEFHDLLSRMLDLIAHFRVADLYLQAEFDVLPVEIQSVSTVLHGATEALDALHTEIDGWHVHERRLDDPSVEVGAAIDSPPVRVEPECHPLDRTCDRIRMYLASMRGLRGVGCYREEIEEANCRGRGLVERLALSAERTDDLPALRLTVDQVADVLSLIASLEPIDLEAWWTDKPSDEPSPVCGYYLLLHALEGSLRAAGSLKVTP